MTVRTAAILLPSLHFGGAERASITLARALVARGVAVEILLMQRTGQFLAEVDDLTVVDLGCDRTFKLPLALARYMVRRRPDLLVCNFWKLSLCACLARLARPSGRLVLWEHARPSDSPVHTPRLYGVTASLFYRAATRVVAVSHAVRDDLLSLTRGLASRTVVVNNPIPAPEGDARAPSAAFVCVGRLDPQKNPMLALEAFALVAAQRADADLAFIGDGALRAALERRAAELGLSSRVRFLGFVPDPLRYMRTARVLVLPSDSEGLGNVLVEALHCGLGIVSTDCGGPRDVVEDQRYGRLVPVGDAAGMARAMEEELDHPRDPADQREGARRFSPDRIAACFLAIVERPGRPRPMAKMQR